MTHGCGQRTFDRPATIEASLDRAVLESKATRPSRHAQTLAIEGQEHVGPRVVVLFQPCRPVAVIGRIGTIIVATFQGITRWAFSHVSVEGFKRIAPFLAHDNPAASVIGITSLARIVATCFRRAPRLIGAGVDQAMRRVVQARCLVAQTAATFRVSGKKIFPNHIDCLPAIAETMPCRPFIEAGFGCSPTDHLQSNKSSAVQVNGDRFHARYYSPERVI